ncbi:MAG TPA: glycine betaine ABC transporter substrate-binding protein [Ilumatobacteraceae bacterium]
MRQSKLITVSLAAIVFLAACGSDSSATSDTPVVKPRIVISSTTDPQSVLIAEIYGQALEKASFRVARKKASETSDALFAAVESGTVQITGATAQELFAWTQSKAAASDALPNTTALQTEAIAKNLPTTMKIGAASTAEDIDVIFCSATFTDANTIATLTDLGTKPGTATLAAPDGFDTATPLGAATLKDTYQIEFKSVVPTPIDQTLEAVTSGTADCGVGRSGDPALAPVTLKILQDDKAVVPNNVLLPVLTADAATADVTAVLDATSARLTTEQLRALNQRLVDGATPELAANEFVGAGG